MKTRHKIIVMAVGALALGASATELPWVYNTSDRPAVVNESVAAAVAQPVETVKLPAEEPSFWARLFTLPLPGFLFFVK